MMDTIPLDDRGLQYGDGCFSTILVSSAKPQHLTLHLQRMAWGLCRLSIDFSNVSEIEAAIIQRASTMTNGIIKLTVTRGSGGRGYDPIGCTTTRWWLSQHTIPATYLDSHWRTKGVSLGVSDVKLAKQPLLAGFKHLNRLEQVLIKQGLADTAWQDVVVLDSDNNVVETANANLFWRKDGIFYTPALNHCGIKGIARCRLIRVLEKNGISVKRVQAPLEELLTAELAMMCNSIMGLVKVFEIQGSVIKNSDFEQIKDIFDEAN